MTLRLKVILNRTLKKYRIFVSGLMFPNISIDEFYQMLKNVSSGKPELENVTVFRELDTGDDG